VTQTTSHVLQPAAQLSTRLQYDMLGNVTSSRDPRQKVTSYDFADAYGSPDTNARGNEFTPSQPTFAFATKMTNALNQSIYTQFDYWTGKPVNGEDTNQVVSKGRYDDLLDRATELVVAVASPSGGALARRTRFVYADAAKTITTYSDQTTLNDDAFRSEILYDGLGRTFESRQYINEPGAPYVKSLTEYDAMGRAFKSSNPHKSNEMTISYTTTAFDGLSRVKSVTAPDGSVVTTNYNGNQATVIDQALKQRRSTSDGLGRLTKVEEMLTPSQVYATTIYTYDMLDNLTQVNQGSQNPRTFVYDSLKRLTSAFTPESGTVNYTYDANSNLLTRTDARAVLSGPDAGQPVKVTYGYDDLNRVTSRTYNDNQTPTVNYTYENAGIANSAGRLTRVSNGVSAYDYLQFDALGRVKQSQQTTFADNSNPVYQMSYSYNLAGEMTSQTYPSGKVVETEYDTAGRLSGVKNQGNYYVGAAPGDATNRIQYKAHGAVSAMKLGNGRWQHTDFNNRLQPTQIGLGTSATDSSLLRLDYTYGSNTNNGNVLTQQIVAPGLDVKQTYTYDQCNRLLTATETPTPSPQTINWKQTFTYDPFGNRNFDANPTATFPAQVLGPNPTISQSNNRFNTGQGYVYDAVGNITQEPGNKSYTYDGENHQVSFTANSGLSNPATTQYVYDGEGRRVKRVDPDNTSLVFVYNTMGQLISEYATNTPTGAVQTSYLTTDHLGSTRVVMTKDSNNNVVVRARYDFLPFGEELTVNRSGVGGYGGTDTTRQKFTGYEREVGSGLDFAQARYYSNQTGRFTSADPLYIEAKRLGDPQQLNNYSYTRNNPLTYRDPSGLEVAVTGDQQDEYLRRLNGRENGSFQVAISKNKLVIVGGNGKPLNAKELKALGKNLQGGEEKLFNAITDKTQATVNTGTKGPNPDVLFGQATSKGLNTLDFSDLALLDAPENKGGNTASNIVLHETLEAHYTAAGFPLFVPTFPNGPTAHGFAGIYFPGYDFAGNSIVYSKPDSQGLVQGFTYDAYGQGIAGLGVRSRFTMQLVTPVPSSSLPPQNDAKIEMFKAHVTNVTIK
jgi:RHS repeat-associated protein